MSKILLEVKNLTKIFTKEQPPALQDITVSIPKGEIVGLIGPDGAGKTTFIRLICGLLHPSEGQITVAGYDTVRDAEYIHYLAGYMPQKFGLYEDLTVMQNLNLYAELKGLKKEDKKGRFEKLLQFTGLTPFTERLAGALSGGMKQKLGIACALIKKPSLLVLDEPSVGVDPISRRELWNMVYDLLKEDISVLWSTAYLDEAEKCKSVLLLSEGKLLFNGDPQELKKRVDGRVFKITNIQGEKRELLFQVLQNKNIIDGVIQGKDIRIVTKEKECKVANVQIESAAPRFEDAFIDILGGGPGGRSGLAESAPNITTDGKAVIIAQGLTKKFGSFTAASNITFEVAKGEIFGLLGPNGAGKSTTFKMMCGLLHPTEGKASVMGVDLQVAPGVARSHIGYMAQKFSLYGNLSVRQNLQFFSGIYNLEGDVQKEAIRQMIEIFNLTPYLDMSSETLPLGIKQRLALACANMHHPAVLFLDEPTSGVDPITRREFWTHINGLIQKGVTIMVTTHFMDEAEYCDRVALVYRGKIIDIDTPNMLKDKNRSIENPNPTLEDAFIKIIENYDAKNPR